MRQFGGFLSSCLSTIKRIPRRPVSLPFDCLPITYTAPQSPCSRVTRITRNYILTGTNQSFHYTTWTSKFHYRTSLMLRSHFTLVIISFLLFHRHYSVKRAFNIRYYDTKAQIQPKLYIFCFRSRMPS